MNPQPQQGTNWKTTSSRTVYQDRFVKFRADEVIRPDGKNGVYTVLETNPAVAIIAMTADKKLILTKEWRYPHATWVLGIPTGLINDGETPIASAQRELQEEACMTAKKWVSLGTFGPACARMSTIIHVFLTQDAIVEPFKLQINEVLERKLVSMPTALRMCKSGKILSGVSQLAIYKAWHYINNKEKLALFLPTSKNASHNDHRQTSTGKPRG